MDTGYRTSANLNRRVIHDPSDLSLAGKGYGRRRRKNITVLKIVNGFHQPIAHLDALHAGCTVPNHGKTLFSNNCRLSSLSHRVRVDPVPFTPVYTLSDDSMKKVAPGQPLGHVENPNLQISAARKQKNTMNPTIRDNVSYGQVQKNRKSTLEHFAMDNSCTIGIGEPGIQIFFSFSTNSNDN